MYKLVSQPIFIVGVAETVPEVVGYLTLLFHFIIHLTVHPTIHPHYVLGCERH